MRRRCLLSGLLAVVAGCLGTPGTDDGSSPTGEDASPTPDESGGESTPEETDRSLAAVQTPGSDCVVTDRPSGDYPALPDSLTESSASTFALEYEKIYASESLDAESGTQFGGFDGSEADVVETTKTAVLVRVHVSLDYVEDGGTATVAGSTDSRAWYYVTESFAVRARDRGGDAVPERGWQTVACAGD